MPEVGPTALGRVLRDFFLEYLPRVRGASRHTVLAYRDSFKLLLQFLANHLGSAATTLDFPALAPENLLAFLEHAETRRGNSVATRNARLTAAHAFARFAAVRHPEHLELCQRILAVPFKRGPQRLVEYLEEHETRALLAAPDPTTPHGRRDRALLLTLYNSGARVQEIIDLRPCDLQLQRPRQIWLRGKGRKERICPLLPETADALRALLADRGVGPDDDQPLFRNRYGRPLDRSGVRYILHKHGRTAAAQVPTLATKRIHPHVMRHTMASHHLQAGVDLVTISHLLGHESVETTNRYASVSLEAKRSAVAKGGSLGVASQPEVSEWRSDPTILDWLEAL